MDTLLSIIVMILFMLGAVFLFGVDWKAVIGVFLVIVANNIYLANKDTCKEVKI